MVTQIKGKSSLKEQNEGRLTRALTADRMNTPSANHSAAQTSPVTYVSEGMLFAEMEQQKAEAHRFLLRNETALC